MMKKSLAIIGGGTAALMFASELDNNIFDIHIYEKGNSLGKKFLVAGKGGFNLTHSESPKTFVSRYLPSDFIKPYFTYFNNQDTRDWLENLGISTIIGSSKKVYPSEKHKPNDVLKAILDKIKKKNVKVHFNYKWIGFSEDFSLIFKNDKIATIIKADIFVFALGGASWKITGSDGKWLELFKDSKVKTKLFEPSNCAFKINWNKEFLKLYEGKPIKNIATICKDKYIKGELIITKFGIEGGAVYALSQELRTQLNKANKAKLYIDLKPEFDITTIQTKLNQQTRTNSITKFLKDKINLDSIKLALLKHNTSKDEYFDLKQIANKIKKLPITISGIAPIDEAISTVGGIDLDDIDKNLKIKKLPNHYAIGEMLDWDAPTGGYLLQASFSMGYYLANHLNSIK